jgi:hypothetical protein
VRLSTGSTFQTADYSTSHFQAHTGGSGSNPGGSTNAGFMQIHDNVGSDLGESISFELNLANPSNTTEYKAIYGQSAVLDTSTHAKSAHFAGIYKGSTSSVDGIQFLFSSGNVESGEFVLYGLRSSGSAGGTDTLSGLSCSSGQIAKWDGSAWACADDNGSENLYDVYDNAG